MNQSGSRKTIVFAGGGTGGHLFPSLAIAECLPSTIIKHFACAMRNIDASILSAHAAFTPLCVQPWPTNPFRFPAFISAYFRAVRQSHNLLTFLNAHLVIAMGGFVSAPVVAAANRLRIPIMLINLDAVPGKANRRLARRAQLVFTVYPNAQLHGPSTHVGFPIRQAAIATLAPSEARRQLTLDPNLPTLLITGASQGAKTINNAMIQLTKKVSGTFSGSQPTKTVSDTVFSASIFRGWQILHLAGAGNVPALQSAYQRANIPAVVLEFADNMGLCWAAADLAISRAGAGSAAEAAINTVPTIFMPYPYHKDQHQRLNVEPLVLAHAAVIIKDQIDPARNAAELSRVLQPLLNDQPRRQQMRLTLQQLRRPDGASQLAAAAMQFINN